MGKVFTWGWRKADEVESLLMSVLGEGRGGEGMEEKGREVKGRKKMWEVRTYEDLEFCIFLWSTGDLPTYLTYLFSLPSLSTTQAPNLSLHRFSLPPPPL